MLMPDWFFVVFTWNIFSLPSSEDIFKREYLNYVWYGTQTFKIFSLTTFSFPTISWRWATWDRQNTGYCIQMLCYIHNLLEVKLSIKCYRELNESQDSSPNQSAHIGTWEIKSILQAIFLKNWYKKIKVIHVCGLSFQHTYRLYKSG